MTVDYCTVLYYCTLHIAPYPPIVTLNTDIYTVQWTLYPIHTGVHWQQHCILYIFTYKNMYCTKYRPTHIKLWKLNTPSSTIYKCTATYTTIYMHYTLHNYMHSLHTTQLYNCSAHNTTIQMHCTLTSIQMHCSPCIFPATGTKGTWREYRSQGTRSHNSTLNTEQSTVHTAQCTHPCSVQQTILSKSVQLGVMGNSQSTCYSPPWIQPVPLIRYPNI